MAIGDVYLLTVSATQFGSVRQNTLAFIATDNGAPSASQFKTIAEAVRDINVSRQHISTVYTSFRARQIRGTGVSWPTTGKDCFPTGGLGFEGLLTGTNTGGESTFEALPPQCALVTTLRTGQIGRSRRGRFYAYGQHENAQNGGTFSTGHLNATDAAWTTFLTTYTAPAPLAGYRLGIWSTRIASGCRVLPDGTHERTGPGDPNSAFTNVSAHVVRPTVFTQRRRVTGVGL